MSYWFPSKQRKDAQPLLRQVAVCLHAVPISELKSQQVPAVLRAHGLRQHQRQAVISYKQMLNQYHMFYYKFPMTVFLNIYIITELLTVSFKLTLLLCKLAGLTDAVSCQVAEDGICTATLPCQCNLLIHPVGGSLGQPGGKGSPPLQLLLVVTGYVDVRLLLCRAQATPQSLTQGPDLIPVSQKNWWDHKSEIKCYSKSISYLHTLK